MKLVRIYALRDDRKRILERLQNLAVMQIDSNESVAHGFERIDTSSGSQAFERNSLLASQALSLLDKVAPVKKGLLASFSGRREVSDADIADCINSQSELMQVCNRIIELDKRCADNSAQAIRVRVNIDQLEPWRSLDIPFCTSDTDKTAVFIGSLPSRYDSEGLSVALAEQNEELIFDFEIISVSQGMTCIVLVVPNVQREDAEKALRSLGFSKPMGANRFLPADKIKQLEAELEALNNDTGKAKAEMVELSAYRERIELVSDYYKARAEKYEVIGELDHSAHTFVLTGYVAEPDCKQLIEELSAMCDCFIETEDADPETAPVKLSNNAFNAPVESIVEMYSSPGPKDIDPTPIMAFFFYFFFGMMFSDAGYGLLMIIATTFILKKFKPEKSMAMNMRLFRNCGWSTFIWGLVYASFFGDAIGAFSRTFFGADIKIPCVTVPLLDPINDATLVMIISVVFGLIQILVGIGAKFYITFKSGDRWGAVFDSGFWMLLLIGLGVLASGLVLGSGFIIAGATIAVLCAIGLVATQGRSKKGAMKLVSGLASLYDITSYISDLMSYTRLLALGLTTAVMGQVFNVLSLQFAASPIVWIFMILVFIIGHLVNFGLNALGSYVHTMRLQYVEMFSKFYDGGGKKFTPFAVNSKYTRLQEETKL